MSWQTNARQRAAPAMAALTAHPVFPKDVQFAPVLATNVIHPNLGWMTFVARTGICGGPSRRLQIMNATVARVATLCGAWTLRVANSARGERGGVSSPS